MPREREPARVTLRDVAEASGVSQSTVSFVLNDSPTQSISERTRERVRQAAHELGYVPHGIARALMEGSSRIVVLNVDVPYEGHYTQSFIRGLDEELAAHGHTLLVRHGHPSAAEHRQVQDAIAPRAVIQFAESYLSGHELEDTGGGWKNGLAAHILLQLRYLADRGHRHIALGHPDGPFPLAGVRERLAGAATRILELPAAVPVVIPQDLQDAAAALRAFRAAHPEVSAVAASNDETALRLLAAMRSLGMTAPGDLAVIGFDEGAYAALFSPSLTTIRADGAGHGRLAARRALALDTESVTVELGRVIARESA